MLNVKGQLERMNLNVGSPLASMQQVRNLIEDATDPKAFALKLIKDITGEERAYESDLVARLIAMGVVERTVKANCEIADPTTLLLDLEQHVEKMRTSPKYWFTFLHDQNKQETAAELKSLVNKTDAEVIIKDNGKIKKGGKQLLANELYKKHVLEAATPLTNQEFIALLVKQLGMTKSGATTYAYNCKRDLGEPAGGIVKSPKGKKAKGV